MHKFRFSVALSSACKCPIPRFAHSIQSFFQFFIFLRTLCLSLCSIRATLWQWTLLLHRFLHGCAAPRRRYSTRIICSSSIHTHVVHSVFLFSFLTLCCSSPSATSYTYTPSSFPSTDCLCIFTRGHRVNLWPFRDLEKLKRRKGKGGQWGEKVNASDESNYLLALSIPSFPHNFYNGIPRSLHRRDFRLTFGCSCGHR